MRKHFLALTLAGLLASFPALSTEATSTQKTIHKKGGGCYAQNMGAVAGEVVLKCDHLGAVTIKKIYEQGWRIVASHLYPDRALHIFIIEEQ